MATIAPTALSELAPTSCPECESTELGWGSSVRINPAVGHGQLRGNDVTPVVFLGCAECSETLVTIDLDQFLPLVVAVLP